MQRNSTLLPNLDKLRSKFEKRYSKTIDKCTGVSKPFKVQTSFLTKNVLLE